MSVSPLERLQRLFVASARGDAAPGLVASVAGGGRLSAAAAVDVYRKGYPARLTEALGETYEACWRVLGDEDFFAVCRDYIARTPSLSHNLSDYGAGFAEHLEARPDLDSAPFLGDLARYERAFQKIFHARPHQGLTAAALSDAAGPGAVFRFGAAVVLLSLRHRVHAIWSRDRADDTPLTRSDWEGAERLVLYKTGGNEVFVRALAGPEHAALSALAEGRPLEDALAAAEGLDEERARGLFAFVAEAGIAAAVEEARRG